jgi:hypothetical protein
MARVVGSRATRIAALIIAFALAVTMLVGCSRDPYMDFEFKVQRAVSASGYDRYVDSNGFVVGYYSTDLRLRSTTDALGGPARASALAKALALSVLAKVPELESMTITDANDREIGTYEQTPAK